MFGLRAAMLNAVRVVVTTLSSAAVADVTKLVSMHAAQVAHTGVIAHVDGESPDVDFHLQWFVGPLSHQDGSPDATCRGNVSTGHHVTHGVHVLFGKSRGHVVVVGPHACHVTGVKMNVHVRSVRGIVVVVMVMMMLLLLFIMVVAVVMVIIVFVALWVVLVMVAMIVVVVMAVVVAMVMAMVVAMHVTMAVRSMHVAVILILVMVIIIRMVLVLGTPHSVTVTVSVVPLPLPALPVSSPPVVSAHHGLGVGLNTPGGSSRDSDWCWGGVLLILRGSIVVVVGGAGMVVVDVVVVVVVHEVTVSMEVHMHGLTQHVHLAPQS